MEQVDVSQHLGGIPIRNIWLLLLYASDLYKTFPGRVSVEERPEDLPDLIAELLCHAVELRLRRSLSLDYRLQEAVLHRVRGRIDVLRTESRQLLARGQVACRFEHLSLDTPRNRYVLAALLQAVRIVTDGELRRRCGSLAGMMERVGITPLRPSDAELSGDRIGRRDDRGDRMMLEAARLLFDITLPTETAGSRRLPAVEREDRWLRRLFEGAVGGFYRVVLGPTGWEVATSRPLTWQVDWLSDGMAAIFPRMQTDIILEHRESGRRIVIDTKFTAVVKQGYRRKETLSSGYVYQLYAYLKSQAGRGDVLEDHAEGLMLHPSIGEHVDETVVVQGQAMRFATVDLSVDAREIRRQLLEVIEPRRPVGPGVSLDSVRP